MHPKQTYEELEKRVLQLEKMLSKREDLGKKFEIVSLAIEQSSEGIAVVNLNGDLQYINHAFAEMHGYSPEELLGKNLSIFHASEEMPLVNAANRKIIAEGVFRGELWHVRKDGTSFSAMMHNSLIKNEDGEPIAIIGTMQDITERKQFEESLRKSEEKYRLLAENALDVIWTMDLTTLQIAYVSPSIERVRGYTPEEAIGLFWEEQLTPASLERAKTLILEELSKETLGNADPLRSQTLELELYCKNGSTMWAENTVSFLRNSEEKVTGFLGVSRNITERKKAEQEKRGLEIQLQHAQKMESIGTLAGGVAHDFNNILFPIMGYAEMLWEDVSGNPAAQEYVQEILIATKRARDVIQQILSFSRQSANEYKPLQIQNIVRESLNLLRAFIPTTINIISQIDDDCRAVMSDATQIHQVLMNLCTNAYQAMQETGGTLEVRVEEIELGPEEVLNRPQLKPGGYARLTVSDTGPGIQPGIINRIFDPYFTTKAPGKGTGLGLSVTHGIVKSHDGDIKVESDPGKGATFYVYLPLIESASAEAETDAYEPIPGGKERILILDDEESIVSMEKQMLERLGYEVTAHTGSIEALETFRSQPHQFDLVISDMTMPNMTGDRLARELMKIRPDIPVILCTGFSERINDEKAKSIGIRAFIMKPVLKKELAAAIRMALDQEDGTKDKARVLIIDDDDYVREMLAHIFKREGYAVVEATDGQEGVKRYREHPPDIVVSDIIMPEKEGIEMIRELKKEFPEVKIIAISGGGHIGPEQYLDLARKIGAARTFVKPVDMIELLETVKEMLNE